MGKAKRAGRRTHGSRKKSNDYKPMYGKRARELRAAGVDFDVPDPFERRGSGGAAIRLVNALKLARIDAAEVAREEGEAVLAPPDICRIAAARLLGFEGLLKLMYEHMPASGFPMSESGGLDRTLRKVLASGDPKWSRFTYKQLRRLVGRLWSKVEAIESAERRFAAGEVPIRFYLGLPSDDDAFLERMFPPSMLPST